METDMIKANILLEINQFTFIRMLAKCAPNRENLVWKLQNFSADSAPWFFYSHFQQQKEEQYSDFSQTGDRCKEIYMIKHLLEIVISMFLFCFVSFFFQCNAGKTSKIGFDLRIFKTKMGWYSDQKDTKIGTFKHIKMRKPKSFQGLCPLDPHQSFASGPHQGS